MKIITTNMPKFEVVFDHPDDSSMFHEFFVDLDGEDEPWTDEEYDWFNKELIRSVWHKYNHYGYYHTMTITAEYVIDGKIYRPTICKDYGRYDIPE